MEDQKDREGLLVFLKSGLLALLFGQPAEKKTGCDEISACKQKVGCYGWLCDKAGFCERVRISCCETLVRVDVDCEGLQICGLLVVYF